MHKNRKRVISKGRPSKGPVLYWMSRDQRVNDNWALVYAQKIALKKKVPLVVIFCIVPKFLRATIRHYHLMLSGLKAIQQSLDNLNVPFILLKGSPSEVIPNFIEEYHIGVLISDFSPLRIKKKWIKNITTEIQIPFHEVDAHNIIPCWIASSKKEYAAYTFRPKVRKLLPEYLEQFPKLKDHPFNWNYNSIDIDWPEIEKSLKIDYSIQIVKSYESGEIAAEKALNNFLTNKLKYYEENRNDPNINGQSGLSPYIHFGQISAQRIALEVKESKVSSHSKNAFLEELIVRRELSDNFCFYTPHYDTIEAFPQWAKQTLNKHRKDKRQYIYSLEEFEKSKTHDEAWNAAQLEMVNKGKMHGYMRMYWAKKILEWTETPEDALKIAQTLNDKYELDGRDPNGYVGIAWSIGGVHDRAWKEREIFGKIRYMSFNGLKRKFDLNKYIKNNINER